MLHIEVHPEWKIVLNISDDACLYISELRSKASAIEAFAVNQPGVVISKGQWLRILNQLDDLYTQLTQDYMEENGK